ncbi:hypothetical protein [Catellatospora tritici]|uniref:hypothetical protein n=1 Tax=Catellatospora tritici TaxID=2851566 RepID=UPI001C2D9C93|nr:hypothetical protein [Catellatospora tritici]MBV1851290.1 hypothetical protein [Catellatospora tritici]
MTASGGAARRRWPWYVGVTLSVLVLVAAAVWLTVVLVDGHGGSAGSGQAGDVALGIGGLAVALASLVVSILQLRQAHRIPPVEAAGPRIPAGSKIRQDVTASVPGAIAQGVIGGDIHNRFDRPNPSAGPGPAAGDGTDGNQR